MGTVKSGLCSISFRKLSVAEIITLVKEAGLQAIEWGGDRHVPHGDLKTASETAEKCRAAGIEIPSYGSYYKVGKSEDNGLPFEKVLASALILGAAVIRVWAGERDYSEADEKWTSHVVQETLRIAEMASARGVTVAFEYHGGTLTSSRAGLLELKKRIKHPGVGYYWQPPPLPLPADVTASLEEIGEALSNLHVFEWRHQFDASGVKTAHEICLLEKGRAHWESYLRQAAVVPGDRYALLEFARENNPENTRKDAAVLGEILSRVNTAG